MKNFLIGLTFCFVLGCTGKTGPTGPNGSNGTPAPLTFQATFQNGIFPTASYSGEVDCWLDANNQTTSQTTVPYLKISTGAASTNYGRVLVRFDVSSLPTNGQVIAAQVILKTVIATSIGASPLSVGVHDLASSLIPTCIWNGNATWNLFNGTTAWFSCDGDATAGQQGMMNLTPMSTTIFTSSNSGQAKYFKWSLTPSVVQGWLTGTNNGLVLRSEGEFGETASTLGFYPYNDATAANHATLIVTYQ